MARPTIEELCGLDTRNLKNLPHHEASRIIIGELIKEKANLAAELRHGRFSDVSDYDSLAGMSNRIKYLIKAIEVRTAEYEMMMGGE